MSEMSKINTPFNFQSQNIGKEHKFLKSGGQVTKKYDAEFSAEFVKISGFLKKNNPIYIIQSVKIPKLNCSKTL